MGSRKLSRRVAALVLVVGLLAAPAAMADRGGDQEARGGLVAAIDQLVHDLMVEVGGWFGVTFDQQSTDDSGWTLDPVGPEGGDGPESTTDTGPQLDPDG
jgi:hypothetical protein